MVIKSQEALDWFRRLNGISVGSKPATPLDGAFVLTAVVYQENLRRDLDIELLADGLQRVGILKNDRAIWSKLATRRIDRENPRVEFILSPCTLSEKEMGR